MKLTARLAYSQLKINSRRTVWTLLGIVLSSAMLTAVCGFVASAMKAITEVLGYDDFNVVRNAALVALGAVFGVIIITAAVVVVSNSFRVSAGERTRQFGILKSVGATKRQIAQSILCEGLFLSAAAIPIGLLLGVLIEFVGTFVITRLLSTMRDGGALAVDMEMPFVVTWQMLAVAVITSFGTVLLSAWLPARKAAQIAAIDAIRRCGEVNMKPGGVKTSKLTQRLFGFEGTLAAKSLKRSRRSFRATVVSLTISIVLLIVAGSFGGQMQKVTNLMYPNIDATAIGTYVSTINMIYGENGEIVKTDFIAISAAEAEAITQKLGEYPDAEIFGVGVSMTLRASLPQAAVSDAQNEIWIDKLGHSYDNLDFTVVYLTVDAAHYAALCEVAGVPLGSNLLVNRQVLQDGGKKREYALFDFAAIKDKPIALTDGGEDLSIAIAGELTGDEVPNEVAYHTASELTVIVPESGSKLYNWYAKVPDSAGFADFAAQTIGEMMPKGSRELRNMAGGVNIADQTAIVKHMVKVIMFFVYGFVGMLTLIALTNVISTISANVRARSGEFAVLESVGMTKRGLWRMLNLESILCSVRSLLFGVPLGIVGAYAAYRAMGLQAEVVFSFPWLAVCECALGVFVITWVTMRYAANRLRGGSIVDAIRAEDGV
jgi:putative ABC transport system permease protein